MHVHRASAAFEPVALARSALSIAIAISALATSIALAAEGVESSPAAPEIQNPATAPRWVQGRLLVAPKAGLPAAEFDKILKGHGAKASRKLDGLNVFVVDLPSQSRGREHALAQIMARSPHIKFAEVDAFVPPSLSANDTYFPSEWHLSKMGATTAWNDSIGSGVTIAVLDSGVDPTHPDLAAKFVAGYNFFDNNTNTADVYGHGTKAAGTAAAITNNGAGVSSVAWNAKIMPIRVTGTDGWATISGLANGTTWAADHGARVISMSFQNPSDSASVLSAASYARSKGAVVIGAAGNTGAYDATAASDQMIIVGATDSADNVASWSSYGPSVDLAAPGVGLYTTTNGGGYATWSGTSAATPVVSGVVALLFGANPSLKPSDIDSILKSTAVDFGAPGRDDYYGAGRIDAAAAVLKAKTMTTTPTADTQPPSVAITSPSGGTVSGVVSVNVSASDNVGVARVELLVAGALLASDSSAPFSFAWDTSRVSDGPKTLQAKAYDASGNVASSTTVTVNVSNASITTTPSTDTTPPVVSIGSPANGARVAGNVTVSASASDNVSMAGLSLYIDGSLVASGNSAVGYRWNSRKSGSGTHTIQAIGRDGAGNSTVRSIQVSN
jgi:subtilisin family serine protease